MLYSDWGDSSLQENPALNCHCSILKSTTKGFRPFSYRVYLDFRYTRSSHPTTSMKRHIFDICMPVQLLHVVAFIYIDITLV